MAPKTKHKFFRIAFFFLIAIWLIAIDRSSKSWAADALHQGVIGYDFGPIALTLVHNRGAAFGMGQGSGVFFVATAIVIVVAILIWIFLSKECSAFEMVGMALVFAGGIGNMIDRLTTGYVVDFIQFTFVDFPVFNVADICVTCGVCMVFAAMLLRFREADREVKREKSSEDLAQDGAAADSVAEGSGQRRVAGAHRSVKDTDPDAAPSPEDAEWEADVAAYEAAYEKSDSPAPPAGDDVERPRDS